METFFHFLISWTFLTNAKFQLSDHTLSGIFPNNIGRLDDSGCSAGVLAGIRSTGNFTYPKLRLVCCKSNHIISLNNVKLVLANNSLTFQIPVEQNSKESAFREFPPVFLNYKKKVMNFSMNASWTGVQNINCDKFANWTLYVIDSVGQQNLFHLSMIIFLDKLLFIQLTSSHIIMYLLVNDNILAFISQMILESLELPNETNYPRYLLYGYETNTTQTVKQLEIPHNDILKKLFDGRIHIHTVSSSTYRNSPCFIFCPWYKLGDGCMLPTVGLGVRI